jgi:hypothetical protein
MFILVADGDFADVETDSGAAGDEVAVAEEVFVDAHADIAEASEAEVNGGDGGHRELAACGGVGRGGGSSIAGEAAGTSAG